MKASYMRHLLAVMLIASAATMEAQELKSGYFSQDFKYRHTMNPAFGNDQGYAAIPVLGNLNLSLQGNMGVGDFLFNNPDFGRVPGAKKTATFMHPSIPVDEALSGFDEGNNVLFMDMDVHIASVGFHAFDGYNTVELKERTHVGLSMPYEFFQFAKDLRNGEYSFDGLGLNARSYVELAFGHSRQIFDNLRAGAKLKLLFGVSYADLSTDNLHATLQGNQWVIGGKMRGELSMKGATFKEKDEQYKSRPGTYKKVDDLDVDGGLNGFGLGLDLGAVYEFKDCSVGWLDGLQVSLALTDLGFINWSNNVVAESSGEDFVFDGFKNFAVKEESGQTVKNQADDVKDRLTDFANLHNRGDEGSVSRGLASTLRFGLEYPLPVYDKVRFGFLYSHRYDDVYAWSEGRFSANYSPLKWLDGGINLAFASYCTSMGWILNIHPGAMNVFIGMDHMMGKTGASMVPLNSNVSFNFGLNVAWGGGKKPSKRLSTLTF